MQKRVFKIQRETDTKSANSKKPNALAVKTRNTTPSLHVPSALPFTFLCFSFALTNVPYPNYRATHLSFDQATLPLLFTHGISRKNFIHSNQSHWNNNAFFLSYDCLTECLLPFVLKT